MFQVKPGTVCLLLHFNEKIKYLPHSLYINSSNEKSKTCTIVFTLLVQFYVATGGFGGGGEGAARAPLFDQYKKISRTI